MHWSFLEPVIYEPESASPHKSLRKQQSNYRALYDNPFRQSQNLQLLKTHKNSQVNLQKIDAERAKHASSVNGGQSPTIANASNVVNSTQAPP